MTSKYNLFHLVDVSPWPILGSFGALNMMLSLIFMTNLKSFSTFFISFLILGLISFFWWRDVHRESTSQGNHSMKVMDGIKKGMVLFIISEIFFFISFFWAFFHSSISPTIEIGQVWPPVSIITFNPMSIPLLNTILLVSSGVTVTWCHHEMIKGNYSKSLNSLAMTLLLGATFTLFQGFEYATAPYSMSDSSFGSIFFMATGFHGLHVIIGSMFLTVSLIRLNLFVNSNLHMIGFECAAWYWHFVDVVWLFLYSMVYWWGI